MLLSVDIGAQFVKKCLQLRTHIHVPLLQQIKIFTAWLLKVIEHVLDAGIDLDVLFDSFLPLDYLLLDTADARH